MCKEAGRSVVVAKHLEKRHSFRIPIFYSFSLFFLFTKVCGGCDKKKSMSELQVKNTKHSNKEFVNTTEIQFSGSFQIRFVKV